MNAIQKFIGCIVGRNEVECREYIDEILENDKKIFKDMEESFLDMNIVVILLYLRDAYDIAGIMPSIKLLRLSHKDRCYGIITSNLGIEDIKILLNHI